MSFVVSLDHGLVDIGAPAKLNFAGNISLMAWVRVGRTDGFRNIIAHGLRTSQTEVWLRIYNGLYHVGSWDIVRQDHKATATVPPEDIGRWVHLCGTHDGRAWRLYRNGVLAGQGADPVGALQVPEPWGIGGRAAGGEPRYFEGLIAHVSVWNVALDAAAIAAYAQYPAALQGSEAGLVAYWPMTEGTGQTIADQCANPANGSLRCWRDEGRLPAWALESAGTGDTTDSWNPLLVLNGKAWKVRGDRAARPVVSAPLADLGTWTPELASPPWTLRTWASSVVHEDCMYLLQGANVTDIWSSRDGVNWGVVTSAAPWAPREQAAVASYQGRLWVVGGYVGAGAAKDAWSSADGVSWRQETAPGWRYGRVAAAACVFKERLYLIAGHDGQTTADVWSTDGASWRLEQEQAFPPRFGTSAVVLGDSMYVLGGVGSAGSTLGDIHRTDNGSTWQPWASTSPWRGREQQGGSVVNGRIVICGGVTRPGTPRVLDDVWSYTPP